MSGIRDGRGPERQRGILSDEEIRAVVGECDVSDFDRAIARAAALKCAGILDAQAVEMDVIGEANARMLLEAGADVIREAAGIEEASDG